MKPKIQLMRFRKGGVGSRENDIESVVKCCVLGGYDVLEAFNIDSFEKLLQLQGSGNAFPLLPDTSGAYQNPVEMLKDGLTLISMFKLDPFWAAEIYKDKTGMKMAFEIQKRVGTIIKKYNDLVSENASRPEGKPPFAVEVVVCPSLSNYDFVLFFKCTDPNLSIRYLANLRAELSRAVISSASLMVFNVDTDIKSYEKYESSVTVNISCSLREYLKLEIFLEGFRNGVNNAVSEDGIFLIGN